MTDIAVALLPLETFQQSLDCAEAVRLLPRPMAVFASLDSLFVKISDDWFCSVGPDDDLGPDRFTEYVPTGDDWSVTFESLGTALLTHYTRTGTPG